MPIRVATISKPDGPVTSLYGVGKSGGEALFNLIEHDFDSDVCVTNVSGVTPERQCHMAILLIGKSLTHKETQLAQEISRTLMSRGALVNVIHGKHLKNIFSCHSWLYTAGTGGVVDTASSILKSLYSPGLIGFDFADLSAVFSGGGMGEAVTTEVPFSSAEGKIRKPEALSEICKVIGSAKRVILIVAMSAEGRLLYVDAITNHFRRSISKNAEIWVTTVFDEKCNIPKLTAIGLQEYSSSPPATR